MTKGNVLVVFSPAKSMNECIETHRDQVDPADVIVERGNIVPEPKTINVWDGGQFLWKYAGDDRLIKGESYSGAQHAEFAVRLTTRTKMRCLPKEHEAARRSSHVFRRHRCLECHYRDLV